MMMMTMTMKTKIGKNNRKINKYNRISQQKLPNVPIIKQLIWEALIIYPKINKLLITRKNSGKVPKTVKLSQYLVQTDKSAA